jgi:hypothetical protein
MISRQMTSAIDLEIFKDDFEPVRRGFRVTICELIVRRSQPDADAEFSGLLYLFVSIPNPRLQRGAVKVDRPQEEMNLSLKLLLWILVACRGFGAVCSATTLALAGVLAFATVVTRFAATLAFTRVLALASVLFLHRVLVLGLVLCIKRRLQPREKVRCLDSCTAARE